VIPMRAPPFAGSRQDCLRVMGAAARFCRSRRVTAVMRDGF
jgi:hypothetical protein